jgi:hypothetical protein
MENKQNFKTFCCIDYPGYVQNEKEAIRTLGGLTRIQQTFQKKNSKFLLNFAPDNIFSKMLCSTTIEDPNERKEAGEDGKDPVKGDFSRDTLTTPNVSNNKSNELVSMPCLLMSFKKSSKPALIGKIKTIYTFQKIADFQYLPMNNVADKSLVASDKNAASITFSAFYDNFLFNNIQNYEYELRRNSIPQPFILPPFFSRFDDPVNYSFKSEPTKKKIADTPSSPQSSTGALIKSPEKEIKARKEDLDSNATATSENNSSNELTDNDKSFKGGDENSSELIRSMRQERSSQAILVAFKCKNIPNSMFILCIWGLNLSVLCPFLVFLGYEEIFLKFKF